MNPNLHAALADARIQELQRAARKTTVRSAEPRLARPGTGGWQIRARGLRGRRTQPPAISQAILGTRLGHAPLAADIGLPNSR